VPPVTAEALAPGDCALVETRSVAVSARGVRERLAAGESVRAEVPAAVAEYIDNHGLYGGPA
jgi:nicotinic acid mononucleotide adenylyltransferase